MILEICMATDDNYCPHCGICLTSIMENNKEHEIHLHLMNNNISKTNIDKLNKLSEKYENLHISQYDINKYFNETNIYEIFDENLKSKNSFFNLLGMSAFSRLFLEDILPENIDKVLYLDCDMIVLDDLSELYSVNIDDYYCAGSPESTIQKSVYYDKNSDPFINSGTLLINLKKWREDKFKNQCIDLIKQCPNKEYLQDQNIVNIIARDKILFVGSKFNADSGLYYRNYKRAMKVENFFGSIEKFDDEQQIKETMKNPTIMHFKSQIWNRPWIKNNYIFKHEIKNPFNEKYNSYKEMGPWKNEPLKDNYSFKSKFYFEMVRFLMIYPHSPLLILIEYLKLVYLYH